MSAMVTHPLPSRISSPLSLHPLRKINIGFMLSRLYYATKCCLLVGLFHQAHKHRLSQWVVHDFKFSGSWIFIKPVIYCLEGCLYEQQAELTIQPVQTND